MLRILPILFLALLPLATLPNMQPGTATPAASPLADASAVAAALEKATPPPDLPGNEDADILLLPWDDYYGNRLEGTQGAWVLIGSTEFAIASVLVFPAAENAEAGLGDFAEESAAVEVNGLEAYRVADRGGRAGPDHRPGRAHPRRGRGRRPRPCLRRAGGDARVGGLHRHRLARGHAGGMTPTYVEDGHESGQEPP
jgi:hypothetical protein